MKTTLNLDDRILENAKARAARDELTLTAFVEDALRARLLEKDTSEPYRFRPAVVTGSRPPSVDLTDRDALYEVMNRR